MMNTKTLLVGQNVYMVSGPYGNEGKVVRVAPEGVEVKIVGKGEKPTVCYFDTNGKEYSPYPGGSCGTYECGPWELVEKSK